MIDFKTQYPAACCAWVRRRRFTRTGGFFCEMVNSHNNSLPGSSRHSIWCWTLAGARMISLVTNVVGVATQIGQYAITYSLQKKRKMKYSRYKKRRNKIKHPI
jgi:hypothetical protein